MNEKSIAAIGILAALTTATVFGSDSGRGRHKQFYVVPTPGVVAIDGRLDDWDLSGQIEMFVVEGISTSVPLHLRILEDRDFRAGRLSTSFMDRLLNNG